MSLQDKIFDVEAALEGKPEAKLFDEIITHLGELERDLEAVRGIANSLGEMKAAIRRIEIRSRIRGWP